MNVDQLCGVSNEDGASCRGGPAASGYLREETLQQDEFTGGKLDVKRQSVSPLDS